MSITSVHSVVFSHILSPNTAYFSLWEIKYIDALCLSVALLAFFIFLSEVRGNQGNARKVYEKYIDRVFL